MIEPKKRCRICVMDKEEYLRATMEDFAMYGIENMHISVMQDELGLFPKVHSRVLPAWMVTEHYQNCECSLLCRLRKLFR